MRLNKSGPSIIIFLKDSLDISQSCCSNFALYMIKRGVLGALLIFDKIFFLSTHIARICMDVGLDWSLDVPFSSLISRHHHHVLFEMKEIFLLVMSEKNYV